MSSGKQRTFFHLPQLLSAISEDRQVFYVEGQKDVLIVPTSQNPKGGITDYIKEGHTKEDLLELVNTASITTKNETYKKIHSLDMISMADIKEKVPE